MVGRQETSSVEQRKGEGVGGGGDDWQRQGEGDGEGVGEVMQEREAQWSRGWLRSQPREQTQSEHFWS